MSIETIEEEEGWWQTGRYRSDRVYMHICRHTNSHIHGHKGTRIHVHVFSTYGRITEDTLQLSCRKTVGRWLPGNNQPRINRQMLSFSSLEATSHEPHRENPFSICSPGIPDSTAGYFSRNGGHHVSGKHGRTDLNFKKILR